MLRLALLVSVILSTPPPAADGGSAPVACQSVAECWLDEDANPIRRPKKLRDRPVPRGNCGSQLMWLRNRLSCEANVCTVKFIGDKC